MSSQPELHGSPLSTEALIQSLEPVIDGREASPSQPVTLHLTTEEWDNLNYLWAELHGDLIREKLREERQHDIPSPF